MKRCGTALNDRTGTYFFRTNKFGASGNLYHHHPLTAAAVRSGMIDIASRCGDDNECLGLKADTLIVPPGLSDVAAGIAKEITDIKQVVELPGLLRSDDVASPTTWYLASCLGPNGALALFGAIESGFEFQTNLRPPLAAVFCSRFAWAVDRYAAAGLGDPAYISRFEAGGPSSPSAADIAAYINRYEQGEPSAPHPNDIAWLDKITAYPGPMFEDEVVFDKPGDNAPAVPRTENLAELIAQVAAMTGLDADKIAARIEKAHAN